MICGHRLREVVEDLAAAVAGRGLAFGGIFRDELQQIFRAEVLRQRRVEFGLELRVGLAPGLEVFLPALVLAGALRLEFGEVAAHFVAHEEMLVRGQAERRARGVHELRAAFAVRLGGAGDFGDALADERAGDDELRLAVVLFLRAVDGLLHGIRSWPSIGTTSQPIPL